MTQKKSIPVILLYGGLAALGMILFTVATYKGGTEMFISNIVFLMYLIPVVFAVIGVLVEKKRGRGFIGFRAGLRICFGIIVLALAVQMIFGWTLLHLIDPAFGRSLPPAVLVKTEAAYRRFGMPEDEISRNIADLKGSDPFSFSAMAIGLARNCILGFLIALVPAAAASGRPSRVPTIKKD
jgi:Protein of unknown function (DUF4199)